MQEWVAVVTQVGVAGVLALWVWFEMKRVEQERAERIETQRRNDETREEHLQRMLKALHDAETAIREQTEASKSLTLVIEGLKNVVMTEVRT